VVRPDQRRARTPREHRGRGAASARRTATVSAVVTAIRSGDRAASSRPTGPEAALSASGSLVALRDAVESGTPVLIAYVDNNGTRSERVVDPVSVEGGVLTAHDQRSDDVRTFAVHRITAVRPISG
jgi:predicted DNA-binding transcriptional regulator YafY